MMMPAMYWFVAEIRIQCGSVKDYSWHQSLSFVSGKEDQRASAAVATAKPATTGVESTRNVL
jgi:hypothetical protein